MDTRIVAATAALLMSAIPGHTDPLATAAKFSITYTFTTSTPASPIDLGNDRDLTVNGYLATMSNDEGQGFLHLVAGHCTNIRFTNRVQRTIDTRAYCNFKDRDGDAIYAEYTTGVPKPDNAITHTWKFTSGTGKYDGIQGIAEDVNSNNLSDDDSYQAAGKMIGSYRIVRPAAASEHGPRN